LSELRYLFMHYPDIRPSLLSYEQTLSYLHYIRQTYNASLVKLKMASQSFSFFFKNVLHQPYVIPKILFKAHENKLPKVLTKQQVLQILSSINNRKHRTIVALAYSTGMRLQEISNVKITDIDGKQHCIKVVSGKGKKDRIVNLCEEMLQELRVYYLQYHPQHYLFNGTIKSKPYSTRSIQLIFEKALKTIGLQQKGFSFHSLRHSYATHMIEQGADLQAIQMLMGHHHLSQTSQYLHLTTTRFNALPNPFATLINEQ
jgi:integrase/recombinase XerD